MAQVKRTAASRRRNTAWHRFWIFPASAALALVALYVGYSDAETIARPANIGLASLVLVAGGAFAGVLAALDKSSARQLPALLAPIPFLVFAGLLLVAVSESNNDLPAAGLVVGITFLLYEIPLAIAFRVTSGRLNETMGPASDPEASARNRELDLATNHGRATTVVREYLADDEGREHLEADTKALEARSYDRVSVAHSGPGSAEVGFAVVMLLAESGGTIQDEKFVATFRHRLAQDDGLPIASTRPLVESARFGCLSAALIVAWAIAGVTVMVVAVLVLGPLQPDQSIGSPLGNVPPLLGLVVAFVGSVQSIKWLRARE